MKLEDESIDMASQANLESQLAVAYEKRVATLESERRHLAAKDDLSKLETRLVKWLVATQLAVIGFLLSTQLALAALVIHLMR
ncbi:MAG: hypothetical protein F4X02_02780 [Chloroflexi bacterium]|nr:hypothetical protein [Chloroflexota bacterium]